MSFTPINAGPSLFGHIYGAREPRHDGVWVHDFHLIPLGQRLREHNVRNRIG